MAALNTQQINQQVRVASKLYLKRHVQALIDIYKDNWTHLIRHELAHQVSPETFAKYYFLITQELNVLKRVINELSTLYKEPAERKAVVTGKEVNTDDEGNESLIDTKQEDENYNLSQKNTNKDFIMQECNRYTNNTNNTLIKVTYREDKLDYDLIGFNNAEVYTDVEDWKKIIAVKHYFGLDVDEYRYAGNTEGSFGYGSGAHTSFYPIMKFDSNEKGVAAPPVLPYTMAKVWVIKEMPKDGVIEDGTVGETLKPGIYTLEPGDDREMIVKFEENPYLDDNGEPILPFVLFQKVYPVERLLDFTTGNDLRDLNINVAILMVWLNSVEKYQSFKQLVFNTDNPEALPKKLKLGPADAIINPTKENAGSVQVLDLQADIISKFEVIKQRILNVLAGYGISPQNFTMSAQAASGFSLKISNIGKIEARQMQLPSYRQGEHQLYDVEKIIWNFHRPEAKISDEAEFEIDFAEIAFPKDPGEQVKQDEFNLRHNIITEIDLIKRSNPDIDDEQAERQWRENKVFNEASQPQIGIQPAQQPGQQQRTGQQPGQQQGQQVR